MLKGMLAIVGLMALVVAHLLQTPAAMKDGNSDCSSSCGSISISSPFRLKGDPRRCGRRYAELVCENNHTFLYLLQRKYYVEEISYIDKKIHLVDANIVSNDYCSTPVTSFPFPNFGTPYLWLFSSGALYFLSCSTLINSSNYVDFSACLFHTSSANSEYKYFYAAVQIYFVSDIHDSCNITTMYPTDRDLDIQNLSISYVHKELLRGFELSWRFEPFQCDSYDGTRCYFQIFNLIDRFISFLKDSWSNHRAQMLAFFLALGGFFICRTSVGILVLIVFCVHRFRRRHLSIDDTIEDFLQSHNNFMPLRYSFSEIKQMTKGFKDKLGQGGFGIVFKGKLRSGRLVAIKLLGKSKSNGQDFINEVATIGRIHHVNVVQLFGFCVEGSKRALVYDYMPNGSLDKFIFCRENETPLSWERTCDVALGVARGIEYLHQGCDMQILHFDIKPHNILLDENFVPKVSDFGLAKLYSTDDSIVSITAARGTLGYIAPELFYKNIGGVSYKADVYSFGMLLMEMVGRRRNMNEYVDHSSQIYYPSWIYDHINQGEDMELGLDLDVTLEVQTLVRKMTVVAMWCIQMKPADRPSMSKVLEMLEGEAEALQIPPKPFFHPQDNLIIEEDGVSSTTSSYTIDIVTSSSSC